MDHIVIPSSEVLFNAVTSVAGPNGVEDKARQPTRIGLLYESRRFSWLRGATSYSVFRIDVAQDFSPAHTGHSAAISMRPAKAAT